MTSSVTAAQARALIDAAFAEARRENFKPMGVVVVDAGGAIVASAREDGASTMRLDIAHGKCGAAIGFGCDSGALVERAKGHPAFFAGIASVARMPFLAQTGAVLLRDGDGRVVGAAGASGGTGEEDEQICRAGAKAAGFGG